MNISIRTSRRELFTKCVERHLVDGLNVEGTFADQNIQASLLVDLAMWEVA